MKSLFKKEIVRYIAAGVCTTAVNLISFYILRLTTDLSRSTANIISITLAIIFAFIANKFFVFVSDDKKAATLLLEFCSFIGARLLAMIVEVLGTNLLCDSFRFNEFISKIIIQFVVTVINYIFGKCFVFKKEKRSLMDIARENMLIIMAFALPAVFMLILWIVEKIGPFGGNSLTMVDSLHQYLPFFSDYYDKLKNEGSLFYSWDIGLGSNLLSIIAYYMSSPLNLIMVLFKRKHLYIVMSLLISFKICASSASMAYFLRYKNNSREDMKILIFSLAYALSNYVIGYSWNLMWMDCIMVFPLVMAGFYKLVNEGKYKLYVMALFYSLLCNYYISFMICLFLVLEFILMHHKGIKRFFVDGLRFAGCSILSAAMSAFLLVPAYLGINTTSSAERVFPDSEWYGSFWAIIKQLFIMTKPIKNQQFDGGVNLYCGTICFILVFAYILNRKVSSWDKLKNLLLIGILTVSFNNTLLNYIWHGFHDQYGIPNRFSFLLIFVLLEISYEGISRLRSQHVAFVFVSVAAGFIFLVLTNNNENLEKQTFIATIVFLAIYGGLLIAGRLVKPQICNILMVILTMVCITESILNAAKGYDSNGYVEIPRYFAEEEALQSAIDSVDSDNIPYRTELMKTKIVDEPIYYNMKSITLFGSTVSGDLVDSMHKLGFYTAANEFLFNGGNTVTNSLMGVKYLFRRSGDVNQYDVNYVDNVDGVEVYENEYALSLGYMVNDALGVWEGDGTDMFSSINEYMVSATGVSGIFSQLYPEVDSDDSTCVVTHRDEFSNYYDYTRQDSELCEISLEFTIPSETEDCYIVASANGVNKIGIYINGVQSNYDRLQNQTYHVGHLLRGDRVTVKYFFPSTQSQSGSVKLIIASLNWDAFLQSYEILSSGQMTVSELEGGYVSGYIDAGDGGLMMTSIPYDKGWSAKVDGKKQDILITAGAFVSLSLPAGEHNIELTYFPPGLKIGMLITLLGWMIFVALVAGTRIKRKEKTIVKSDGRH
jgi:uncharacterized membrane protein YfhO/putative flippase GtrA